jgi:hypothetical protein
MRGDVSLQTTIIDTEAALKYYKTKYKKREALCLPI